MLEADYGCITRTSAPLSSEQMVVLLKLGALYLDGPNIGKWREFSHLLMDGRIVYLHTALEPPHMVDLLTAELYLVDKEWSVDFYLPHGAHKRLLDQELAFRFFRNGAYEDSPPWLTRVTADAFIPTASVNRLMLPP